MDNLYAAILDSEGHRIHARHLADNEDKKNYVAGMALEIVNEIRTALLIGEGKLEGLPQAQKRESQYCVVAKALSNGWKTEVTYDTFYLYNADSPGADLKKAAETLEELGFVIRHAETVFEPYNIEVAMPTALALVAQAFDEGFLPEYDMEADLNNEDDEL